jgi:MFS family permease
MFWQQSHIRALPEVRSLTPAGQNHAVVIALIIIMVASIAGNFVAGALARRWGYRLAITLLLAAYGATMIAGFSRPLSHDATLVWFGLVGLCQGVFGLFTMCLPPLFPTLLRTTGAGFCYNIGRLVAAGGTVFFGLFVKVDDYPPRPLLRRLPLHPRHHRRPHAARTQRRRRLGQKHFGFPDSQ